MNTANDLKQQVFALFEPAQPSLIQIQTEADAELNSLRQYFEVEFQRAQANPVCSDKYLATLKQIVANTQTEIRQCVQAGVDRLVELRKSVEAKVAAIVNEVHTIQAVVAECRASESVLRCLLDNVSIRRCIYLKRINVN